MSAALLSALVQESTDSKRIAQLTNNDGTNTINTIFLEKICERAIGTFRLRTGIEPVLTSGSENFLHVDALEHGVLYTLEAKKGRDVNILNFHKSQFYALCKEIRENAYSEASTSSNYKAVEVKSNTQKDMDINRSVFRGRRGASFGSSNYIDGGTS